ncbi:putative Glycosyl transferase, group 1 [Nitrospira defluvii]|uniref:Putative Glycosyl transferase, group 1 n=1 Tax=Nitrospira defluvii TaxID=330214 RepID=D8PFR9_9BACT|nr:putative Glycosyl transferase, group 1 [Nitrospira defluvii]
MATLGIFTVKKVCSHDGQYYTYGGFGEYLAAMRAEFPRVLLVAHVRNAVPPRGYYLIPPGDDLRVIHLPWVNSELGTWLIMPLVFWRAWQASGQIDVGHARMPNHTGVIGAFLCRIRGVPVFCQIIADWYIEAQRMPVTRKYGLGLAMKLHLYLYDLMERLVCRGQMVFAQGQTCFDKHHAHSDCELVLSTAHHLRDIVLPTGRFQQRPFTILTVARLTRVKNQELTLHALSRLCSEGEDWNVVFVGEGPRREALEMLAHELGVRTRVTFAGQVQRGDALWQYFDTADCFVLSSRSEGTPKVLLEAMARGLPVIASNVAGVPTSVTHQERGLLFEDDDLTGLVASLRWLAADPALRECVAANAHHFCIEHTVEKATGRMLDKVFSCWPHLGGSKKMAPLNAHVQQVNDSAS